MVKYKTTPRTMGRKLEHKQLALVKKHFPAFLAKAKQHHKGKLPASIYLAKEYVDYLGAREKLFAGIDSESLTYKMAGFKQLYDHVRKRTHVQEEEKPPTPAAPMPTTSKVSETKSKSPEAIKLPKEPESPVAATPHGHHYHGHHEEKEMPLRHHIDSEQDESDPDAGDQGFEEDDEEAEDEQFEHIGLNKFQRAKQLFIDLVDAYEEDELGKVTYEYTFGNANIHVIQKDRAQFD